MSRLNGFTLLEIMVVVGVMGLITLGGLASYRKFSEKQQVVQAAEDFVTQLRIVQKNADAGIMLPGCTGLLDGYTVSVTDTQNYATITPNCTTASPAGVTFNLKNNSSFTVSGTVTIKFLSSGRGAIPTGVSLRVDSSGDHWCVPIEIGEGGAVKAGDVVAC